MRQRPILLAALLFTTAATAQEPPAAAHRDLWCGLAFDYAAYTAGYLDRYARADARFDSRRAAA